MSPGPQRSGGRMILTMGTIGFICGILIVFTFQVTLPAIKRNKANALEKAIFEVVPGARRKVAFELRDGKLQPARGEEVTAPRVYACFDDDRRFLGVALEASGQGFQDAIRLIYGYSPERGRIVGMKVLESKETPGLGDKIGSDPVFLANFDSLEVRLDGESIAHPIALVKPGEKDEPYQIEAITGATISSRAVTSILRESTSRMAPAIARHIQALSEGGEQ